MYFSRYRYRRYRRTEPIICVFFSIPVSKVSKVSKKICVFFSIPVSRTKPIIESIPNLQPRRVCRHYSPNIDFVSTQTGTWCDVSHRWTRNRWTWHQRILGSKTPYLFLADPLGRGGGFSTRFFWVITQLLKISNSDNSGNILCKEVNFFARLRRAFAHFPLVKSMFRSQMSKFFAPAARFYWHIVSNTNLSKCGKQMGEIASP